MRYYGTRDKNKFYTLQEAAKSGLAPCGGLYMPESIPQIDLKKLEEEAEKSFADMAYYVADLIFGEDMDKAQLKDIIFDAYNFALPLHQFGDSDKFTLELFHGPTLAFKDFGARFMSRMLSALRGDKKTIILTATSGDTGSAVADGFYGVEGIDVYILFPEGKVSDFQERQMTTLGGNIHALRVDGSFDDCQAMVKEVFANHELCAAKNITSANSISILRWVPQSFYYFWGYIQWKKATGKTECDVVVPSGNFGNITAAILAYKMGLPLRKFVAATNSNDTIPQFLKTKVYTPKPTVATCANAMDVGNPSNYERLVELMSWEELSEKMVGLSYTDEEIEKTMGEIYEKYGYLSCPHSAVGYAAMCDTGVEGFYASTAHSSKFADVIERAVGVTVDIPDSHKGIMTKEKISNPLGRHDLETIL
ncbi:MAG: threonine synthase [Rikenellaceae bacterium]